LAKFRRRARARQLPKSKINEDIPYNSLKVVLPDEWIKEMSKRDALNLAESEWLDLVLISDTSKPPICKIVDYWKHLYDLKKKENIKNKNQQKTETKWIRLSMSIWDHDLGIKAKQAKEFLEEKNSVKVTVQFRWRELSHKDLWIEKMKQFAEILSEVWQIDQTPKMQWRQANMLITPLRKKK